LAQKDIAITSTPRAVPAKVEFEKKKGEYGS